jgi:hypothetical protein
MLSRAFCRRDADKFFAGGEDRAIFISSPAGAKRRRPPEGPSWRGRQREFRQVVEITERAVKQWLDEA